jgi:hypothetical protein
MSSITCLTFAGRTQPRRAQAFTRQPPKRCTGQSDAACDFAVRPPLEEKTPNLAQFAKIRGQGQVCDTADHIGHAHNPAHEVTCTRPEGAISSHRRRVGWLSLLTGAKLHGDSSFRVSGPSYCKIPDGTSTSTAQIVRSASAASPDPSALAVRRLLRNYDADPGSGTKGYDPFND